MLASTEKALDLAKKTIDKARKAQESENTIKHYRTVKRALNNVDKKEMDTAALNQRIDYFRELAKVLDDWDEKKVLSGSLKKRAIKCRERADTLR